MTCTCGGSAATTTVTPGSALAKAQTFSIAAGATTELDGATPSRRSVLVANQSAGRIVVAFGQAMPVDGGGQGIEVGPGQSISVSTTAEVNVLNPTASAATVALVTEQD